MEHVLSISGPPNLFPFSIDLAHDRVEFLRLNEMDYAQASFLDSRVLTPQLETESMPWQDVQNAALCFTKRCHFIFHISHVGSTLLSRLLGHHKQIFSIREPAILRTLADANLAIQQPNRPWDLKEFHNRLGVFLTLFSRTFKTDQMALIKATSFVSEISSQMMADVPESKAIFMFVSPITFLKALLGGAISDIKNAAGKRLLRLHRRIGECHWNLQEMSLGECVAMSWLCEMLALSDTAIQFRERVLWLDFDQFLKSPSQGLSALIRHLGFDVTDEIILNILHQPTIEQYAKAPEKKFDAFNREQILENAQRIHAVEITKGMNWLNRAITIPSIRQRFDLSGPMAKEHAQIIYQ